MDKTLLMYASFSITMPRWLETYVLEIKDLVAFCRTASANQHESGFVCLMRQWLRIHEYGRGSFLTNRAIHLYYHAARLQRCYLRFVQCMARPSVFAGSYVAMQYTQANGGCGWEANDIDIWVFCESDLLVFRDLYKDMVLRALDFQCEEMDGRFYDDGANEKDLDLPHCMLEVSVQQWCDMYALHEFKISEMVEDLEHSPSVVTSMAEDLLKTMKYLPRISQERPYRLVRSIKVFPMCPSTLPKILLPINIIQVDTNVIRPQSTYDAFICSGFDLTCCCAALSVNENHTYEISTFCGADKALKRKSLEFQSVAFAARGAVKNVVALQMRRVKKYLERSFSWP